MKPEPIEFVVSALTLRGNFYNPESDPKKVAILFIHGWTGLTNEDAARVLAENGFYTMTFSLSGHNDSDGKLEEQTRRRSLDEVLAAYDFFSSKLPPLVKIGAAGNSYGGYLATLLSAERPLAFIQLRVPANYTDELFSERQLGQGGENPLVMKWRHEKLDFTATRALSAMHGFGGPVQIIEAQLDDHVPHQTLQNFVDAVADKTRLDYHFMPGWPHSLGLDENRNTAYQRMLLDWLNTQA